MDKATRAGTIAVKATETLSIYLQELKWLVVINEVCLHDITSL